MTASSVPERASPRSARPTTPNSARPNVEQFDLSHNVYLRTAPRACHPDNAGTEAFAIGVCDLGFLLSRVLFAGAEWVWLPFREALPDAAQRSAFGGSRVGEECSS